MSGGKKRERDSNEDTTPANNNNNEHESSSSSSPLTSPLRGFIDITQPKSVEQKVDELTRRISSLEKRLMVFERRRQQEVWSGVADAFMDKLKLMCDTPLEEHVALSRLLIRFGTRRTKRLCRRFGFDTSQDLVAFLQELRRTKIAVSFCQSADDFLQQNGVHVIPPHRKAHAKALYEFVKPRPE